MRDRLSLAPVCQLLSDVHSFTLDWKTMRSLVRYHHLWEFRLTTVTAESLQIKICTSTPWVDVLIIDIVEAFKHTVHEISKIQ